MGTALSGIRLVPVGGGSINHTYQVMAASGERFFAKINTSAEWPALFASEKEGLERLAHRQLIRTPRVIALGEVGGYQLLILEWIEQGLKTAGFWKTFGEKLAALHQVTEASFGLATDNYMGALPQHNEPTKDWSDFFRHRRLEPQVKRAMDSHLMDSQQARQFDRLYERLPAIFDQAPPSLQHGDLWSGNFLCDEQEQPVLIDPAVYFGHRSIDLGMTTLFGGFDSAFYESYTCHASLAPNYREQWMVAKLYPLLIHLNLFGKAYLPDIIRTIERY